MSDKAMPDDTQLAIAISQKKNEIGLRDVDRVLISAGLELQRLRSTPPAVEVVTVEEMQNVKHSYGQDFQAGWNAAILAVKMHKNGLRIVDGGEKP